MAKEIIHTRNAPEPVGPYNQAVKSGHLVFCAGQIPIDPEVGKITVCDIAAQTHQVFKNIKAVLSEKSLTLEHVVKTTVFLKNLNDFKKMNEVYSTHFNEETAPARSTVEVARLPMDSLVEIEVIASLD